MTGTASLLVLLVLLGLLLPAERRGDRAPALVAVLGLLVADAAVFPKAGTANGLLLPALGPLDLPPGLVLVPGLLLVRALVAPRALRTSTSGLLWVAFFGWSAVAALDGLTSDNDLNAVLEQVKGLLLLAGGALLLAGTPWDDLVGKRGLPRVVRVAALAVLALAVTSALGLEVHRDLALVELVGTGRAGSDFATVVASLGLVELGLSLSGARRGLRPALPALVCLAAPALTGQRASMLAVVVGVLVVGLLLHLLPPQAGVRLPRGFWLGSGVAALVVATGVVLFTGAGGSLKPVVEDVESVFVSQGQLDSVQSRYNQWAQAWELVRESPWTGHGLGEGYAYVEVIKDAPDLPVVSPLTHNVLLDQLLRTGVVGAALLSAAFAATALGARRRAEHSPPEVAAVVVTGLGALVGLGARAMVESVLEKQRLALALGVLLGVLAAAARPAVRRRRSAGQDWRSTLTSGGARPAAGLQKEQVPA